MLVLAASAAAMRRDDRGRPHLRAVLVLAEQLPAASIVTFLALRPPRRAVQVDPRVLVGGASHVEQQRRERHLLALAALLGHADRRIHRSSNGARRRASQSATSAKYAGQVQTLLVTHQQFALLVP